MLLQDHYRFVERCIPSALVILISQWVVVFFGRCHTTMLPTALVEIEFGIGDRPIRLEIVL